jgi:lipoprotein-releasing system permease protein
MLQGLLVSVIGTFLGLVLGYALSWAGGHFHFIHMSAEVYSLDTLPFAPRLMDGVVVAAVALAVSLLATIYPSRAAAGIHPAEALRYE